MLSLMEEIRFWTGIMRDHGDFILNSLSYNEQEAINCACFYKNTFSKLHEQSKRIMAVNDTSAVNAIFNECMSCLLSFIDFKRLLLGRLLKCQLGTSLPPTFYNHMINEAMEFYQTLLLAKCTKPLNPTHENLNLHTVWLPDSSGHAATIACELDPVEKELIKEAKEFQKSFMNLSLKAEELEKMLKRTCLDNGALKHLNEEVMKKLEEFICYLEKVRELNKKCRILSVLKPLMPDHMMREEIYYLGKLAIYKC
ncbi:MAG: DUF2935 domain-containing protein [Clostridiaceae bacterium]|nr:DUF2935 domain-containing protein [Clostridiaceae bacterium]